MPCTPSPLRYPGGKTKLYNLVRSIIKENNLLHETYIEPFAGGAGLALKLLINNDVKRIVLNDLDPAIYAFWYCVLNHADELCRFVNDVDITIQEWDRQREVYLNQADHPRISVAKAVLFLNRTNVSGVIKGGVIGGREQDGTFKMDARFNRDELVRKIRKIASLASRIDLYNLDAAEFISNDVLGRYYKVFINFDPPYVDKGGQLYKNSFTEEDHEHLRDCIAQCRRKWIVTYDVSSLVKKLYCKFRGGTIDIYYSAKDVRKAKEYIFFSNNLILPSSFTAEDNGNTAS